MPDPRFKSSGVGLRFNRATNLAEVPSLSHYLADKLRCERPLTSDEDEEAQATIAAARKAIIQMDREAALKTATVEDESELEFA